MKSKRFLIVVVLMVVFSMLMSGCYLWDEVNPNETGVEIVGGQISEYCKMPGVHTSWQYRADLRHIKGDTLTFEFQDPSVATKDTQIMGVTLTIQAKRKIDCESAKDFIINWPSLLNDDALVQAILATAGEATKNGTRGFTFNELLSDRNGLANAITEALIEDAGKYNVGIVNVIVKDVQIDPEYQDILKEKAELTAQIEMANRRKDLITANAEADVLEQESEKLVLDAQLLREQAQTSVQVEIAQREGEVVAAQWNVYIENEKAFELRKLELLGNVVGDNDKMWFIPQGFDLTTVLLQGDPLVGGGNGGE